MPDATTSLPQKQVAKIKFAVRVQQNELCTLSRVVAHTCI